MSDQPPTSTPPPSGGHSSASLARASALMASGTFVSRLLGMVRVLLLAGAIGVLNSPAGNAWQTANTLPNTIYILLAGGVLNVVLVPALTRAMAMSPERGRDFTDRLITLALTGLALITVVFTAGAAVLTKLYALSWTGEQLALAITFAYLCLPQIFFYGVYTLLGQILNSREKWGWYMWAPVANNIVAIAGIVLFMALYPQARTIGPGEWTPDMIWLLAGTATLGVAVQAGVLIVPTWRSGFRYRPRWGFRGVGLGAASRMAMWMLAIIGVSQAGMWLSTNVLNRASALDGSAPGKILYENAFLIYILPHSLIATSLITAMFTQMSRSAHAEDLRSLGAQYRHGLRLLGVAMVPISVGLFLLAPAMTSILFFNNTWEETIATAWVTMAMVIGLAPYAVYILSGRIFHAFQDGWTPFRMQVVITTVSIAGILVSATLPATQTAIGVGFSQTLGQAVAAVLGLLWVRKRLGRLPLKDVLHSYLRITLATVIAGIVLLLIVLATRELLDGKVAAAVMLFVGGPVFFLVYGLVAHKAGVTELAEAAAPLLRRLGRGPKAPAAVADRPRHRDNEHHDSEHRDSEHHDSGRHADSDTRAHGGKSDEGGDTTHLGDLEHEHHGPRGTDEQEAGSTARRTQDDSPGEDDTGWQTAYEDLRHAEQGSSAWTSAGPALGLGGAGYGQDWEVWGMGLEPGTMLGRRYALEELLAQRGDVLEYWSAQDTTLERLVAVTLLPSTGDRAILAHAVLDGARRTAGVDDPRLVRVLDVGEENGYCWIVEEGLPDAESLASLTVDGPLPAEEARRLVGEAAVGMESARRRGLHHLYLNPHSVLRTRDGSIKVSGVGVTAAIEQTDDIEARAASVIDTADLVALLYTGLTAQWPGDEIDGLPSAQRRADGSLPAPSDTAREVPGDLDALCVQMLGLDYDPTEGPQTPGELARQLAPWASEIVAASSAGSGTGGQGFARPQDSSGTPRGGTAAGGAAGAAAIGAAAAAQGSDLRSPVAAGADEGHERADDHSDDPVHAEQFPVGTTSYQGDDEIGLDERYEQRPDRGLPPGIRERDGGRGQSWVVLLIVGVLVLAAVFAAYSVFSNLGDDTDDGEAQRPLPTTAPSESPTDEPTQTSDDDETTAAPEPGAEISLVGASDFDSNGSEEKPDLTARAIDGDPETWWNTFTYLVPNWGGLKDGVGLVIDTGETQPITEVTVTFPDGDYGATVYVGDSPDTTGTAIGTSDSASEEWVVTADEPVEGRYIVIYFDRAWAGPNGEIVRVAEVSARS
ncbi:murein biosynthesis integral membrane protein MurJ [Ornithinimicrobium ciconiae]|uniref:Murein biosynthesis integral membrane protein MurJ n=1 Tax=Ornithinimicrobium ciconiae TaxID=2594265 RepID=A0A516G6G9_9MICO|nr:murein biosynthesis integral membrane protein MurJ [Ornithinimicrobium ciconiae]QDO87131.1 murein biosynthesis integral membrane protein MurJ [Ornithinimicrobium ciconiae]